MTILPEYPRWIYYPNWSEPPSWVHGLVHVFANVQKSLDSRVKHKTSNEALAIVCPELEKIGYVVEKGKVQKIRRPVRRLVLKKKLQF